MMNFSRNNPFKNFKLSKKGLYDSMDWFSKVVGSMFRPDAPANGNADAMPNRLKEISVPKGLQLGSLYLQSYDAKWKDELPVWDQLPLFFMLRFLPDGYLGLNLHYMPLDVRIGVLGTLMEYSNNTRMDDSTRLRLSWNLINSVSKLDPLKDCVKHYLFDHVTSTPTYITPTQWIHTASLPLAKWVYKKDKK
jgi:hypothetical protein